MTKINRISFEKLYDEDQLVGYSLYIDNVYEVEDRRFKNRISFTYEDKKDAIITYTECEEDEDIESIPAYDATIIPIEMLKILGSCMLNAEQLMKDLVEADEYQQEENTSDT